jgi:hypothetical protein
MNFQTIVLVSATCVLAFFPVLTSCNQSDAPAAKTAPATGGSNAPVTSAQQTNSTSASNPAQNKSVLVKVATIDGVVANDEFTRNVQVVQAQRQEIVRLNEALQKADAGAARDQAQAQLDAAVKKLEADNQTMSKTYGYSIVRNYVRVPDVSQILVVLTEEEIAKQPAPTDGSAPSKTLKVCSLNDTQANQSFQDNVQKLQQMRQQAVAAKDALDKATETNDKAYKQGQFDQLLKQLNDANAEATKAYAFNLNRQYQMQIEKSTLYVQATPEEAAAAAKDAANAGAAPSATPK